MKRHILLEEDRGQLGATTILVDMDAVEHIGMVSTNQEMYFTSTGQLMPITHKQGIQLVTGMYKAGLLEREHMELLAARIEVRRRQIENDRQKAEWAAKQRQTKATEALEAALEKIGKPGHLGGSLVLTPQERATALQEIQNYQNRQSRPDPRDLFTGYDDPNSRYGSGGYAGYGVQATQTMGTVGIGTGSSTTAPAQSEPAEQAPPSESQD